jgi:hypothetical protein
MDGKREAAGGETVLRHAFEKRPIEWSFLLCRMLFQLALERALTAIERRVHPAASCITFRLRAAA